MVVRSQLALLHFNSIVNAEQAYTKVSQCYVVKPVREVPEKTYLEDLMSEIIELAKLGGHSGLPCIQGRKPNLERPSKEEVIQFQRTRFSIIRLINPVGNEITSCREEMGRMFKRIR